MPNDVQKCLIYCRVSDSKQKFEGSGLESQEFRCRQYAAEKGYSVEQVFHDDVSGGGNFAKRPGMVALLDFLEKNQKTPHIVIFDDLKRLARDTMFHWQLRHAISNFGSKVECLNYQFDDSPEGEFMETLFAAQGQLERKQIGRQTKQKTKARLEAGYHAFIAPMGFKFIKSKVQGKILVKDEPVASIIAEMMEGFVSGRFQTKNEAKRFLENTPEYPKQSKSGRLGNNHINNILTNPLYAGYIEYKPWGITLRKGQHEGMVSYEAFCKIQEKLKGRSHAPARKNLNLDFPLRGAVACECGNSLTGAWSKSRTGKRHAYYVCQNRKCDFKGKSIRRDILEGAFEDVLSRLKPSEALISTMEKMFKARWSYSLNRLNERRSFLETQLRDSEKSMNQLLDRIIDTESAAVAQRLEERVEVLQKDQILLQEKLDNSKQPVRSFDEMYRTALGFLSKPLILWKNGQFEDKRAVLKLVFSERLIYTRNEAYRTPELSLPFKALGDISAWKMLMVQPNRETSNALFKVFEDWNSILKTKK